MTYFCCDERAPRTPSRRIATLNGIDFLEVVDDPSRSDRRCGSALLFVHFVKPLAPDAIARAQNVRIDGGERIRNIT